MSEGYSMKNPFLRIILCC